MKNLDFLGQWDKQVFSFLEEHDGEEGEEERKGASSKDALEMDYAQQPPWDYAWD